MSEKKEFEIARILEEYTRLKFQIKQLIDELENVRKFPKVTQIFDSSEQKTKTHVLLWLQEKYENCERKGFILTF